jgi:hypothetical protein
MSGLFKHIGGGVDEFAESLADERAAQAGADAAAQEKLRSEERLHAQALGWREVEGGQKCCACGGRTSLTVWWRRATAAAPLAAILPRRSVVVYTCATDKCAAAAVAAAQAADIEAVQRVWPNRLAAALAGDTSAIAKLRKTFADEAPR